MNKLDIQQEIRNHLIKTKQEFDNHLSGKEEKFLLKLALQTPERQEKFKKILGWIKEALGDEAQERNKDPLEGYKTLYNNWNESNENKTEYDGSLDFGGKLLTLKSLLEKKKEPQKGEGLTTSEKSIIKQIPGIVFAVSNYLTSYLTSPNNRILTRAETLFAEFKQNDLSLKANPNLNEGIEREQRSNTRRLSNSFEQSIEVCQKLDKKGQ